MFVLRPASRLDALPIVSRYESDGYRLLDEQRIAELLESCPSMVATLGDDLVAFCYTLKFGPDVLEIGHLYVTPQWRGHGLGARLLSAVEGAASPVYRGAVLVNSMNYPGKEQDRPARSFYLRQGYTLVLDTGPSLVFVKELKAPNPPVQR